MTKKKTVVKYPKVLKQNVVTVQLSEDVEYRLAKNHNLGDEYESPPPSTDYVSVVADCGTVLNLPVEHLRALAEAALDLCDDCCEDSSF